MLKKALIMAVAVSTIFSISACSSQRVSYKRASTQNIETICIRSNTRSTGMEILEPVLRESVEELGYKSEIVPTSISDRKKCPHVISYSAKHNETTFKKLNLKLSEWWDSTGGYESLGGISFKKRVNVVEDPQVAKFEIKEHLKTLIQKVVK